MERQGFGIRLAAFLVDFVFLFIASVIIGVLFGLGFSVRMGTAAFAVGAGYILVSESITLAYWSTEVFMAASPGKKLLGLAIANEDGTSAPPDRLWIRFAIKHAPNILSLLAAFLPMGVRGLYSWFVALAALAFFVGCFLTLGQARQALHDILAHTAVFKLAPAPGFPVMPMQPPPPPSV
ncbi:MAG TPA: RDD family protein [Tepidisphaeraceae bacterium]|nr:RDD family protein [Tepidisphaeraceae bacterium]